MFKILFSSNDLFCMKLDMDYSNDEVKSKTEDICIPDSGTTHTFLKYKRYFSDLKLIKTIINTLSSPADLIERTGKASFILPNGTKFFIKAALFSPKFKRNLLSFNDIYLHGYDTQSATEGNMKYMYLTIYVSGKKYILEKLPKFRQDCITHI